MYYPTYYVKGYTFDWDKIICFLEIPEDDKTMPDKVHHCMVKILDYIDRDVNPICMGRPLDAKPGNSRSVIITAEGDDLDVLKEEKGTEPRYLKQIAEAVLSGPDIFIRVD